MIVVVCFVICVVLTVIAVILYRNTEPVHLQKKRRSTHPVEAGKDAEMQQQHDQTLRRQQEEQQQRHLQDLANQRNSTFYYEPPTTQTHSANRSLQPPQSITNNSLPFSSYIDESGSPGMKKPKNNVVIRYEDTLAGSTNNGGKDKISSSTTIHTLRTRPATPPEPVFLRSEVAGGYGGGNSTGNYPNQVYVHVSEMNPAIVPVEQIIVRTRPVTPPPQTLQVHPYYDEDDY